MIPTITNFSLYSLHEDVDTYTPPITNFETLMGLIDDAEKFSKCYNCRCYIIDNNTGEIIVTFANGLETQSSPYLNDILDYLANINHI